MSQENVETMRGVRSSLRPLSERASQHRSLDEHLFVRFPAAYRLLADAWMRLPARSRLRRLMLARLVQRGTAAMNRRDFALVLVGFDPEIEWHEDPQRADAHVYLGHDGVRESFERWLDQWDEYGTEVERFIDCGDDVLVVAREHGRGASSGATVTGRIYFVMSFRNGKVLRYREFYDEAAALEAVGLSEQDAQSH
jgi:ketosteroid isomerase-like protein